MFWYLDLMHFKSVFNGLLYTKATCDAQPYYKAPGAIHLSTSSQTRTLD